MIRIIRVIIQNSLHQNKNREEVNNLDGSGKYLISLFLTSSLFIITLIKLLIVYIFGKSKHLFHLLCFKILLGFSSLLLFFLPSKQFELVKAIETPFCRPKGVIFVLPCKKDAFISLGRCLGFIKPKDQKSLIRVLSCFISILCMRGTTTAVAVLQISVVAVAICVFHIIT